MRLFLATSFPSEILRDLADRVSRLRPRLPHASWVRPESQHVTFAFLGEQPETLVDVLAEPLETALRATQSFTARLKGCGVFPNARHARVGWVGLEPEQNFASIATIVRDIVTRRGVQLDRADFKPHLTLMRMREGWPPASISLFCNSLRDYASAPFPMEKVTLYSSQLNPNGAVHTALREFAMGQ